MSERIARKPLREALPRHIRRALPKAPWLHIEWAPAILPGRPWFQRNRLANAARLRIGSIVIIHRATWLPAVARVNHPHLFNDMEDKP